MFTRRFGCFFGQLRNGFNNRLELLMTKHDRAQHGFLGKLAGFRFNHQNRIFRARNNQIEIGLGHFVDVRVQHEFPVDIADARTADRTFEGHTGKRQGGGGCDHCDDVRIVFQVVRDDHAGHLSVVLVTVGKQRADGPVDQTADQDFVLRRTCFALEEAAGNLSGRIGLFDVVDGEREEIEVRFGRLFRHNRTHDRRFAIGGDNAGVCLTGNLAGFDRQRAAAPLDFN